MRQFASVILIIAFVLSCGSAEAQRRKKARYKRGGSQFDIKYGVKFGAQNSNFTGDDFLVEYNRDNKHIYPEVTYKATTNYHAGLYMDIRFNEAFILQPELLFTAMGTKMIRQADLDNPDDNFMPRPSSNPVALIDVPITRKLNYVQMPIVAKIPVGPDFQLNFGAMVGFKVSEDDIYGDVADSVLARVQFTDPLAPSLFNSLDYGGIVGFTYQLRSGFNLALRYNRNFANLNKNEGLDILALEPVNNNSAISLSLGFSFMYHERLRRSVSRRF